MPTLRTIIDEVNALKTNSYTDAQKLIWINEVEQDVKEQIVRTFLFSEVQRIAGTTEYDLPNGVVFEDIEEVFFNGKAVDKLDQRSYLEDSDSGDIGFYKTSAGKLGINPAPAVSDDSSNPGVRISYLDTFTAYTSANSYGTSVLLTKPKHLRVYRFYLLAQIDLHNEEYENYNNKMLQFNSAWKEFADWYSSRQPVNKSAVVRNIW